MFIITQILLNVNSTSNCKQQTNPKKKSSEKIGAFEIFAITNYLLENWGSKAKTVDNCFWRSETAQSKELKERACE